jgi:hypothetical protein
MAGPSFNDDVLKKIENAFGNADFSDVKVNPSQGSRDLGAKAFTEGKDVKFGGSSSSSSKSHMAHEATHVVQQGQSNGFSKEGAKQLMDGNVPSNPADRARLRSSVPHTGPAGAPLSAGVGPLAQNKPIGYVN